MPIAMGVTYEFAYTIKQTTYEKMQKNVTEYIQTFFTLNDDKELVLGCILYVKRVMDEF